MSRRQSLLDQLPKVYPAPGSVSVTRLPHHGPARTVAASVRLARLGHSVVPHLAARSIGSEEELHGFLRQLLEAGVSELFIVAGDRRTPEGPYAWSGQLLDAVKAFSPLLTIGIAGYPEGHPGITAGGLKASLDSKAPLASCLVMQMCFSADDITRYLDGLVHSGLHLPVWVGIPGPVSTGKLVAMATRLGVGRSIKLAMEPEWPGRCGTGSTCCRMTALDSPERSTGRWRGHPLFAGFHIYTFNDFTGCPACWSGFLQLQFRLRKCWTKMSQLT